MAERPDLDAAAAAGVISRAQAHSLKDFLDGRANAQAQPAAVSGEEDLRFIRNFHDVFLAIGIVLFAVGLAIAIGTYVAGAAADPQQVAVLTGALVAGAAAVMWLLGELFARRRRLFLPAIAIVCAFTLFALFAAGFLYTGALLGRGFELDFSNVEGMPPELRTGLLVATAMLVIAPLAFYLRFRLPFSLGLTGAGAAVFVVAACLIANFDLTIRFLPSLYLALGVLLFLAGVAFDARDPARASRFSDNGFWLHFAAAPLILNGALSLVTNAFGGDVGAGSPSTSLILGAGQAGSASVAVQAAATLAVIAVLGLVSLLINRRALIVSALLTTGTAIGVLMNAAGLGAGALAASTLIVLGAFVLILGAGWHGLRRMLLGRINPTGPWARLFPPETAATV